MTKQRVVVAAGAASGRRGRRSIAALMCSTALALPSIVLAQETGQGGAVVLDPIIVTGRGESPVGPDGNIVAGRSSTGSKTDTPILDIPAAVSVVTEEEMETRGVDNLQQALSYTSSVAADVYGSDDRYDYFMIRGFDQTTLGTYRDGLPVVIEGWTASRLEPYGLQRIDILKGSTSTLFGMNSPGGLVNAITKRPQQSRHGEVYTTLGEDHVEVGTDFGGRIDEGGIWSYRVTALGQEAARSGDHSNDDRRYFAPALTYQTADRATTLTLLGDYNERDSNSGYGFPAGVDVDPDTFLGEPDFNRFDTREANIGYQFEHAFDSGLTFRQAARYTHLQLDYEQVYIASADPAAPRAAFAVDGRSNQVAIDNQLQYDAALGDRVDTRTLLGIDYTRQVLREVAQAGTAAPIDINDPVYCGTGCIVLGPYLNWRPEQDRVGLYAQEELTLDDRWILTLGGRYDYVSKETEDFNAGEVTDASDNAFTTRAGLTYKVLDGLSLYANYSESFQPLLENNFEAQEGTQYEVGAKFEPAGFDALFTVALFDLTQTNVPKEVLPNVRRQIGEVNVRGIELEGKMALNDRMNLTAAYSYWDSEIEKDGLTGNEGNRPIQVPEHIASAWVDYTIPGAGARGDLTFGVGGRFVGSSYGDEENTVKVPSRTVFDAAVNYRITDNVDVAVHATNLFDREYVSTQYFGTVYYGDSRKILGTLRYSW